MPENLKAVSLTRCWVVMKNKSTRVFYSRDRKGKKDKPNQSLGIRRFRKMLFLGALKDSWKLAIIYENKINGEEIDRINPDDGY